MDKLLIMTAEYAKKAYDHFIKFGGIKKLSDKDALMVDYLINYILDLENDLSHYV